MPRMITTLYVHGMSEYKVGDSMYIYYVTRSNVRAVCYRAKQSIIIEIIIGIGIIIRSWTNQLKSKSDSGQSVPCIITTQPLNGVNKHKVVNIR